MLKKLIRLPIQIFVFVLFLIVVILSLAQLQIVKDRIRDILVSELNKSLNGKVYIANITGNFITYLELSGIGLKVEDDFLIKANGASIKLNPFALLDNKLIIKEFQLYNPQINIKKLSNGKWNFESLTKGEPDTTQTKSNLSFDLSGIEIINGKINFNTNLNNINSNTFDFEHFKLDNFNLSTNFYLDSSYKKIEIGHLSFVYNNKNVLKELSAKFYLDKNNIKIDTINLEYNNTFISLSGFVKGIDIDNDTLTIDNIKNKQIGLTLNSSNVDINDIKFYVPSIELLSGNYKLNLLANGTLEELNIYKMNLITDNSNIKLYGKIKELYDSDQMAFNIKLYDSDFDFSDLKNNFSALNLPDYSSAGKVKLNVDFDGEIKSFNSKININGNFGNLSGIVELDNKENKNKYKVDLSGTKLNLEPFLGPSFNSRLNCKIIGSGTGFEVENINTEFNIIIDSSRFLNQPIDKSKISITFINKHCNALIAFSGDNTKIGLNTEFNLNKTSNQSYNLNLSINNLDLSKFTNDQNLRSNINLSSSINGEGISINKTKGEALLYLFQSKFKNDSIPEISLNIKYNQLNPNDRKIYLYSDLLDLEIKGKYQIDKVSEIFGKNFNTLIEEISSSFPFPKTEEKITLQKIKNLWIVKKPKKPILQDTIDIDYFIHLKKVNILKDYLKCKDLSSNIKIDGKISYLDSIITLSGDIGIDNLFYLSKTNSILIQDSKINFSFSGKEGKDILFDMKNRLSISSPIIYFNKNSINNIILNLKTEKNSTNISLSSEIDKKTFVNINGNIKIGKEEHHLEFSKLYLKHLNYEWRNDDKVSCLIKKDGVDINSLSLSHADEKIVLEGSINKEGEQNLSLLVSNLRIENLLSLISSDTLSEPSSILTGKINISGEIFGTADDPIMNIFLRTDSLSTNHKYLGSLFGKVHYEESEIFTNIQFQSSGIESLTKSDLVLIGTIPINLSLTNSASLFPDDEEIDLYLVTNKLPLRLVSLVIPEISNSTNTADINFHVFGTGNAPEIEGYLTLNKGTFTLLPNGITYTTQGRIDITTKEIKMALNIENLQADRKDGRMDIYGTINLADLKLESIDIRAKGQLQVLQKEKRKSNKELYGDLLISTSGDGIRYKQNFKTKTGNILSGNILIKDANLYLPLTTSSSSNLNNENEFKFIIIDDTSTVKIDSSVIRKRMMKQSFEKYISENNYIVTSSPFSKLEFRFDVKTLGNAKIEIEMDPLLGEALVAEIGGNVSIVKTGENISVYGLADIGEKSYYKFAGKKFDASGKIIFTGSLENPELDMKASYQSIHVNEENLSAPKEETVVITITMKGPLLKPITKYDMTIDGKTRDKGDTFNDIISFILTGKFNDELTSNQKQNLASSYSSSLYSIGSGVISGKLTEFFKNEFEFIRSVETEYSGELTTTNVKIAGEIGNTAIFRFGGKVFSDINNANINLELPVGKILNKESLRNLILEIYRNTSESTKNTEKERLPFFGTRIFYRINF